jgi:hypothetical protein
MADARSWFHSFVLAAGCGLSLTAACEQRTAVPPAQSAPHARPTTFGDSRSLMRALRPRMDQPPGGVRADEDGHGNLIIRHNGVFQNVMVGGRGGDGGVVTGGIPGPKQVPAVPGDGKTSGSDR